MLERWPFFPHSFSFSDLPGSSYAGNWIQGLTLPKCFITEIVQSQCWLFNNRTKIITISGEWCILFMGLEYSMPLLKTYYGSGACYLVQCFRFPRKHISDFSSWLEWENWFCKGPCPALSSKEAWAFLIIKVKMSNYLFLSLPSLNFRLDPVFKDRK